MATSGDVPSGYDYEFTPQLDSKYECPICLLCMRDPVQTRCGHRFCQECILGWIRVKGEGCPEDKKPLTETDVFPDNFIKREILQLTAHCPNHRKGCNDIATLNKMDMHLMDCDFQDISCPNNCSVFVMRKELDSHLQQECPHRQVSCQYCQEIYVYSQQEVHLLNCLKYCEVCGETTHTGSDCPKFQSRCVFSSVGCGEKLCRSDMPLHLSENTQKHLQLLCLSHKNLSTFVSEVSNVVSSLHKSLQARMSPQTSRMNHDSNQSTPVLELSSFFNTPPAMDSSGLSELSFDFSQMDVTPSKQLPTQNTILRDLCEKNVQLEQKNREQMIQMKNLHQKMSEFESHVMSLDARYCCGQFVWKLDRFSEFVDRYSAHHETTVRHSPGFYTHPFGYKVCLRMNLHAKENGVYLAMFIHIMKGENDGFLEWPFTGSIEIAILDQSEDGEKRYHIIEKMRTKPNMDAFKKPKSQYNTKGYGYTTFCLASKIRNPRYLNSADDSILIRAVVIPHTASFEAPMNEY